MIANRREYRVTQAAILRFKRALASEEHPDADQDPLLQELLRVSIESQIQDLQSQLDEYNALLAGKVTELRLASLSELPQALIKARLMAGLTQRQLAERLGVAEDVVQRDEADRYDRASFNRLLDVMDALGVKLVEPALLSLPAPGPMVEEMRRQSLAPRSERQASA